MGRTARIGGLAAGQAIRQAGTHAANVARTEEGAQAALERRHIEAAEQIVDALGHDEGRGDEARPGDVVPRRRARPRGVPRGVPAQARDAARRRADGHLQGHAQGDRGRSSTSRSSEVFEEFDEEPIAAASIGQVYRAQARTTAGEVAVKVQYPGRRRRGPRRHAEPRADPAAGSSGSPPGWTRKAIGEEIRDRIEEELDYELEAQNQRTLARIFRGHPFIVVPDVVTSLSRERVMVTEYVDGHRLRGAQDLPAGGARPDRRDPVPLLLRLPVPPPPVLRRPAPRQLDAARRRPHGVLRLRPVQADAAGRGRARDRRSRARSSRATPRRSCGSAPRPASSPSPRSSTPSACSSTSAPRPPGTRSTSTSS